MTLYKAVGWFSLDPFDETVQPFPVTTTLLCATDQEAWDRADQKLRNLARYDAQLMNWYVQKAK